ncbi:unnamed protein product [Cylindrotheca closterium]|uniref:Uncharacterized protein n=1 Tax=Cylindrotheca closterium TaxID=2856 RepID=A0AAD2FYX2_9STRA|nr:unnamed protein product [Cylindrotheca closterium]
MMTASVPSLKQQEVPSLVLLGAAESPSNSLVSTLSFKSREDIAPRVPKRKPSKDLDKVSSSKQQGDNFVANTRFDDGCISQDLGSSTRMASVVMDSLSCLSHIAKKECRMTSTSTSVHLMDDLTTKSDTSPTIPRREPSSESSGAIRECNDAFRMYNRIMKK